MYLLPLVSLRRLLWYELSLGSPDTHSLLYWRAGFYQKEERVQVGSRARLAFHPEYGSRTISTMS